jgi:hypothetical protein
VLRESRLLRDTHSEPQTEEEIAAFRLRWNDDPEGFAHRWSLNRFPNVNIARELSTPERAQRDRERALLGPDLTSKPKKTRRKKSIGEELGAN